MLDYDGILQLLFRAIFLFRFIILQAVLYLVSSPLKVVYLVLVYLKQ